MIYNTRNWSYDTTGSQKEKKTCFNAHLQYSQLKITGLNKMLSLKGLAILKCESRINLLFHVFIWLLQNIWTKFSHRIKSLLILPPNCHHQIMISKTQISSLSSATIWVGNLILLKSNNDHIRKTILFLRLSKKSCLPICPMTLLLVKIETHID